jgi:hypothetical protein
MGVTVDLDEVKLGRTNVFVVNGGGKVLCVTNIVSDWTVVKTIDDSVMEGILEAIGGTID